MKFRKMVGAAIVIGALGMIAYQATRSGSVVTFYTPQEVYADLPRFERQTFRVSGLVLRGSKRLDPQTHVLHFEMTDLKTHNFHVQYQGTPPDLFKEGQGVVVEGYLDSLGKNSLNPLIKANLLMVKHSEVYDTRENHEERRQMKILDSIR